MKLHWHQLGEGPPLVLLHGLFGSSTSWLGVARALAARFAVQAVDLRNHGRSPHAEAMTFAVMAEDVGEFLDDRGFASVHLLGHSLGGKVAMQFALTHPARVRRLIVEDIAPRAVPPDHREVIEALRSVAPERFQNRNEMDAALAPRIPDAVLRRFLLKNVAAGPDGRLRWQMHLEGIHAAYGDLTAAIAGGRPFGKPALFLRGGNSDYIADGDWPEICRWFAQARCETVPGAGHWLHADAPAEFSRRVLQFLEAE